MRLLLLSFLAVALAAAAVRAQSSCSSPGTDYAIDAGLAESVPTAINTQAAQNALLALPYTGTENLPD